MSVRRLAEIQPASFDFTPRAQAWVDRQIAKYPQGRQASAVIPLLWQAQKQNDYWLPKPAIEKIAGMLGMPYIRVLEIATFYTMFNLEPVGKFYIQMCGTTPCMLRGSDDIKDVLHARVGEQGHVTADGLFLVARGRMSRRVLQCPDGTDQRRLLRRSDDRKFRQASRRSRRWSRGACRIADRAQFVGTGWPFDEPDFTVRRGWP